MSILGAPAAKPAKASVRGFRAAWWAPPGRKPAAAVLAFTNLAEPETMVRAPAPGMVAMLGTLEVRSSSRPAAGADGAAAALSALLCSLSHFSLSWSAWLSVGDGAADFAGALSWFLLGAFTWAATGADSP